MSTGGFKQPDVSPCKCEREPMNRRRHPNSANSLLLNENLAHSGTTKLHSSNTELDLGKLLEHLYHLKAEMYNLGRQV